jgi:hypothetical protein
LTKRDEIRRRVDAEAADLFFDLQALLQEHGGVAAIQDELVGHGVIRPGPILWVKVTRVSLVTPATAALKPPDSLPPILRFVVSDADHRPLHSFGIERKVAVDALHLAHPSNAGLRAPVPAFVDVPAGAGSIRAGDERYLSMSMVRLDESPDATFAHGAGVRFEVSGQDEKPLYSFTIDWPLAFLVINAAYPEYR